MKLKVLALLSVLFLAVSCGSDDTKDTAADKKFGKLKVEIPASLKDKPEVCKYIKEMNVIVDDFAVLFDEVIEVGAPHKGKKEEDLSFSEKITLAKAGAKFAFGSTEIMARWGACESKRLELEKDLTTEQKKDLDKVYDRMDKRMNQITDRHKEFFKETEEKN